MKYTFKWVLLWPFFLFNINMKRWPSLFHVIRRCVYLSAKPLYYHLFQDSDSHGCLILVEWWGGHCDSLGDDPWEQPLGISFIECLCLHSSRSGQERKKVYLNSSLSVDRKLKRVTYHQIRDDLTYSPWEQIFVKADFLSSQDSHGFLLTSYIHFEYSSPL